MSKDIEQHDSAATILHLPVWQQDKRGWEMFVGGRSVISLTLADHPSEDCAFLIHFAPDFWGQPLATKWDNGEFYSLEDAQAFGRNWWLQEGRKASRS